MIDIIRGWITTSQANLIQKILIGLACCAAGIVLRLPLEPALSGTVPYATFFPVLLVAGLFGGRLAGAVCLAASGAVAASFLLPSAGSFRLEAQDTLGLAVFVASGGLIVVLAAVLRGTLRELAAVRMREQRLVAEMNHRVKNNFQLVASILHQQARRTGNNETREHLGTAVQRVHLLAKLHDGLASTPDTGEIDFRSYLQEICAGLRETIGDPGRVRLTLDAEPAHLEAASAVPLGFVVNELVTNAIKYAYPPPAHGEISVSFKQASNGYTLRVADGGAGLPEGVEANGSGLGMRLVKTFVEQTGGTIELRHTPGVEYEIHLPARLASSEDRTGMNRVGDVSLQGA